MTRRPWLSALGFGLCSCLLPACTNRHGVQDHGPATPPMIGQGPAPAGPDEEVAVAPRFPYALIPTSLPKSTENRDGNVEQAGFGAGSTPHEETPPAPKPMEPTDPPAALPPVTAKPVDAAPAAKPAEEVPLVTALRCYLSQRPDDARTYLQRYEMPNQELLLKLLPLAAHLSQGNLARDNPKDVAVVVDELQSLLIPLRPRAALVIDQMCFCMQIDKFGSYVPMPAEHKFRPSEVAQVYVELRNFSSECRNRFYLTHLTSSVEIRDYRGEKVWRQDFPEDRNRPDLSRTLRNDYFNNYRFYIPQIPQGRYTLWIRVVDVGQQPHRSAERSIDFEIKTMPDRNAER